MRPKYLFIALTILFLSVLTVSDIVFASETPRILDPGNIFLSQCLALLATTTCSLFYPRWRKGIYPWLAASCTSILLISFSFLMFYKGPGIVTESDGPQSIGYECVWDEYSTTVTNLTGKEGSPLTTQLCVLKNMPLAASNVSPYRQDYGSEGLVIFLIYEAIILGSFMATRKYTKTENYYQRRTELSSTKSWRFLFYKTHGR